jgi:ferritin-like metal-binding protein YciE
MGKVFLVRADILSEQSGAVNPFMQWALAGSYCGRKNGGKLDEAFAGCLFGVERSEAAPYLVLLEKIVSLGPSATAAQVMGILKTEEAPEGASHTLKNLLADYLKAVQSKAS